MRNAQFGASDDVVTFTADATFSSDFGTSPAPVVPPTNGNPDPAFAAREAAFAAREAEFAAKVAAFEAEKTDLKTKARKFVISDNAAFAEKLISEGRLLPVYKDRVVSILEAASESQPVSFAEGEQPVPMLDALRRLMAEQPKVVSFGKMDLGPMPDQLPPRDVVVPEGYSVDASQSELYRRAHEIEREKNISFAEAVEVAGDEQRPRVDPNRRSGSRAF